MSDQMETILLIGATSGLGEALARAFHAQGKKLILTGRRTERLESLKQELSGIETTTWDITDLSGMASKVDSVMKQYPKIDTVIVNSGIMQAFSLSTPPSETKDVSITSEVTTNIIAPFTLAHHFTPHLTAIAEQGKQAVFMITSSGLGFLPMGFWPVYCATKAAVHSFLVSARQQAAQSKSEAVKKNLNFVEIVPPYVEATGIGEGTRPEAMKNMKGLTIDEWTSETMEQMAKKGDNGKMLYEIAAGSAKDRVAQWRQGPGSAYKSMGLDC